MYYVYILKSIIFNHHYIGYTNNLDKRLTEHNAGKVKSTKKYLPWEIIYTEVFNSKPEAYKRELKIKSYKGGNAFKNLISSSG
jgi:putative endonuclease